MDNIWYGQSGNSFYDKYNTLKYSALETIFDYKGGSNKELSWNNKRRTLYRINNKNNLEFTEFTFNETQKKHELRTQIMDILSMTNLRDTTEIDIMQIPKESELINNLRSIKTNQMKLNSSMLINIKVQDLYKQHALNIHKYIQVFLLHLSIIKNKYNIITQEPGFSYVVRTDEKFQLSWNKYENRETIINLENEYAPLYNLINEIKKEEPETLTNLIATLERLYKTDPLFTNCQHFMTILSELQFQIEDDAELYTDYPKFFTGRIYLDLMRSIFYLYIVRVIQFIKNEFYSNVRTNNISLAGKNVLTFFTQIMRDIIFDKINSLYSIDKLTEGGVQEELDKQKARNNESRKKAFDRKKSIRKNNIRT